jgi:hypothetical protein
LWAAGEPLRALARAYGVSHTKLGRYFASARVLRVRVSLVPLIPLIERAESACVKGQSRLARPPVEPLK